MMLHYIFNLSYIIKRVQLSISAELQRGRHSLRCEWLPAAGTSQALATSAVEENNTGEKEKQFSGEMVYNIWLAVREGLNTELRLEGGEELIMWMSGGRTLQAEK